MLNVSANQRRALAFIKGFTASALGLGALFALFAGSWRDIPFTLVGVCALICGALSLAHHDRGPRPPVQLQPQPIWTLFTSAMILFFNSMFINDLLEGWSRILVRIGVVVIAPTLWYVERQRFRIREAAGDSAAPLSRKQRWLNAAIVGLAVVQLVMAVLNITYLLAPCNWLDLPRRSAGCITSLRQPESMTNISYTPDGRYLATAGTDSQVRIWSVQDRRVVRTLQGHTSWVTSVAVTPDGQTLASGSWDSNVRLWRMSDGALLRTLTGPHSGDSVAFSPDGAVVASASSYEIRLWRVADGALLHTISDIGASDVIVFTPDGATLVAGGNGKTIELWDVARGTLRRQIEQPEVMSSMSLSRDGRLIAAGDNVGVVRIWRISDGALVHQWTAQNDDVSSLALSQDGALLASGGDFEDKTAHIWRVADGALLQTIKLRYSSNSIAFAPDERTIAIAAYRNVYLWRVP